MSEPKKDVLQTFDDAAWFRLGRLVADHRQAVLATVGPEGRPYTAMVAYAVEPGGTGFLLHLSDLSAHKSHLRADERVSLMVFEPDKGGGEILLHARVNLSCRARILAKGGEEEAAARQVYLSRFPGHQMMFTLKDFDLLRLEPMEGLLNAGFGKAYAVRPEDLVRAAELVGPSGGGEGGSRCPPTTIPSDRS